MPRAKTAVSADACRFAGLGMQLQNCKKTGGQDDEVRF